MIIKNFKSLINKIIRSIKQIILSNIRISKKNYYILLYIIFFFMIFDRIILYFNDNILFINKYT